MSFIRSLAFAVFNLFNIINLKINNVKSKNANFNGLIFVYNRGTFTIGPNAKINSSKFKNVIGGDTRTSFVIRRNATLTIGSNFRLSNSAIYCTQSIYIGNNVMIGGSCRIWDTDFHSMDNEIRKLSPNSNSKSASIVIEDDVFVGAFSIILKGVAIGKGAIIGAGSIVTKSVPPNEVWGGNPAKFIKSIL